MNYSKIYDKLIERAKQRERYEDEYYELHHIVTKCMNGKNELENVVYLTAREHFVAHALLVKIFKETEFVSKLICAFKFMSASNNNQKRTSKEYSWMRKMFSENHPMKNPMIAMKTSKKLKEYYEKMSEDEKELRSIKISNYMKEYFNNETV
jgi:hypothetical protein